jgi:hypothetical protein
MRQALGGKGSKRRAQLDAGELPPEVRAAMPVVPVPQNGSSTMPPGLPPRPHLPGTVQADGRLKPGSQLCMNDSLILG